jgi:hypothetical protein
VHNALFDPKKKDIGKFHWHVLIDITFMGIPIELRHSLRTFANASRVRTRAKKANQQPNHRVEQTGKGNGV